MHLQINYFNKTNFDVAISKQANTRGKKTFANLINTVMTVETPNSSIICYQALLRMKKGR